MKNYFTIGLMALTLAFGVTSCDKQDNGGSAVNALSLEAQGLASKVTFGEDGDIGNSKGFKNLTAKDASEFTHIYATSPQVLTISSDTDVQYTGSYTAGNISSLDPSEILLANGDYTATSSNADNDNLGLVSGFAPYTSTIDFNLSAAATIQLAVTHERGFVIANSEDAIDGSRITSVVLSSGEVSGNLIVDGDDTNDFYGYLEAGTYGVVINYTLDNSASSVTGSVEITNGVASTLAPMLTADAPIVIVTTDIQSAVVTSTEAAIRGGDGLDVNLDGDMLDGVTRTVTTTIVTTGGVAGTPSIVEGAWAVLEGQNVNDLSLGEDSGLGDSSTATDTTEVDLTDEEISSAAAAVVTGGLVTSDDPAFGAWVVVEAPSTQALTSRSRTRVVRTSTSAQLSTVVTSYSIQINGDEDVPALVAQSDTSVETILVQGTFVDATETETEDDFANPAYEAPAAEWGTEVVSITLFEIEYVTLHTNDDYALSFVIDVDPLGGAVSYQLVDTSLSGDAQAIGDLVAADDEAAAITAAQLYIANN